MKTKLEQLQEIAREYCRQMGYTYIFANEYKFGFETKQGGLWTMTYDELAEKLKEMNKNEN
jgi:hypothetical protein